uniref:Uncharacterized protein n=1 Tax=Oryza meridionalis TaxID=40149 RepID=A0A0E0EYJ5_9ORYZ
MAGTKLAALGFVVLLSIGLASAARVERYSSSQGSGTGGGEGGGSVNGGGAGKGSGVGSGSSNYYGAHASGGGGGGGGGYSQYGGSGSVLAVLVLVAVPDKPVVIGHPTVMDQVAVPALALARLIITGVDHMQTQMPVAMVAVTVKANMVAVALVRVLDLGTVMQTLNFLRKGN